MVAHVLLGVSECAVWGQKHSEDVTHKHVVL